MIARVARAIYELRTAKYGDLLPADSLSRLPWERQAKAIRENYMVEVRAAIEAMREPGAALGAGEEILCRYDREWDSSREATREIWVAMIDAALKEGQE